MKYAYTREDIARALNFEDVMLKDGRPAMRVTMCRLLTENELKVMRKEKHFLGLHLITRHKYAPEIRKSYFYDEEDNCND